MTFPARWTRGSHTYDGVSHGTYRRGSGPAVVVVPEIPGTTHRQQAAVDAVLEFLAANLRRAS